MNTFQFAEHLTEAERETYAERLLTLAGLLAELPRGLYTTKAPVVAIDPEDITCSVADAVGQAIINPQLFEELTLAAALKDGVPVIVKKEKPDEVVTPAEFAIRVNRFFGPKINETVFNSFEIPPKRAFIVQRIRSAAFRRYGYKAA